MKKIAILQSNYIPWKGVFDLINQVDIFVFLEDVQFTRRDWRTRNRIRTNEGDIWLSIPVIKAPRETKIHEIKIFQNEDWQQKHYETIKRNYVKADYFNEYKWLIDEIYLSKRWTNLSEFNIFTTKLICRMLEIKVEFYNSKTLASKGKKEERLINICKKLNGDFYLSGPSAKNYIDYKKFKKESIELAYIIYEYPEYKQIFGGFNHYVSILDVIFNCGPRSGKYIFHNKYDVVTLK